MTLSLSALCVVISAWYGLLDPLQQRIVIETLGASPARISQAVSGDTEIPWGTVVLSLFLHSSPLHLVGNLAYLWVFGIPVESRLGAAFMAFVFLVGGSLALGVLAVRLPQIETLVIGASGAVSAVVGACAGLYPMRRIGLYLPLGLVVQLVRVPTLLVVGSWFVLQLLYSALGPISSAMAWWTHLAGFVLGLMFALLARAFVAARPGRNQTFGSNQR